MIWRFILWKWSFIINVINSESNEKLGGVFVFVNDNEMNTDGIGVISLNAKRVGEKFNLKFNDGDVHYYSNEITFKYDSNKLNYKLNLKPVAYLYVNTYYGNGTTPFKDIPINMYTSKHIH